MANQNNGAISPAKCVQQRGTPYPNLAGENIEDEKIKMTQAIYETAKVVRDCYLDSADQDQAFANYGEKAIRHFQNTKLWAQLTAAEQFSIIDEIDSRFDATDINCPPQDTMCNVSVAIRDGLADAAFLVGTAVVLIVAVLAIHDDVFSLTMAFNKNAIDPETPRLD